MIPGLSTLKTWAMALLAGLAALATIFGLYQKNRRIQDEHEDVQNAQMVERQDAKITTDGMVDEAKTRDEVKGKSISEHFRT